ncbi:MAG: hypothetical protein ACKODX_10130 [Gemmata sp.]
MARARRGARRNPACSAEAARLLDNDRVVPPKLLPPAGASKPDLVGQPLGRFQVLEWVAGGSFADVFRVYDPKLKRERAAKVLRGGDPARFRVEAERVAGVRSVRFRAAMR